MQASGLRPVTAITCHLNCSSSCRGEKLQAESVCTKCAVTHLDNKTSYWQEGKENYKNLTGHMCRPYRLPPPPPRKASLGKGDSSGSDGSAPPQLPPRLLAGLAPQSLTFHRFSRGRGGGSQVPIRPQSQHLPGKSPFWPRHSTASPLCLAHLALLLQPLLYVASSVHRRSSRLLLSRKDPASGIYRYLPVTKKTLNFPRRDCNFAGGPESHARDAVKKHPARQITFRP